MQIATIAGPAVAGLLILVGTGVVYATVTVLILISAYFIWGLRAGGAVDAEAAEPITMRSLLSGVRFVRDHKPILGSMSLDLFAVLFGGATALLPAIAGDVLHVGPVGLGFLRAAPAVGAALAGRYARAAAGANPVGRWLFGGVFVSASRSWSSGCRSPSGCQSSRSACWAPRTWSACTCGTCWCSSRRRTSSEAGSAP